MRILFLTQWFDPEPTFKGVAFARALQKKGYEVEVLTGFPNYPGGKLYDGYRIRPWQREVIEGLPVTRVPLYPSHDSSGISRITNYLSFAASTTLLGPALVRKPDVIYLFNLVTLAPAAYLLRALHGCPVVCDVQDIWPQSVSNSGMMRNRRLLSLLGKLSGTAYRKADRLVVLSPGFKSHLVGMGVEPDRVEVIYNWTDERQADACAPDATLPPPEFRGRFNVLFAGTLGRVQALDTVLHAAALLRHTRPELQFVFVGSGVEEANLRQLRDELGLDNVLFLPRVPYGMMGAIYSAADALLVHLKDDPLHRITIPGKTQAYMSVGKPILMGIGGDAAFLIEDSHCGLIFRPEDPSSLADAARRLMDTSASERAAMGERGREYYRTHLSLDVGVERFSELFEELAGTRGASQELPGSQPRS